jgi:hypothetical protein
MFSRQHNRGRFPPCLWGVLLVLALPAGAEAGPVYYRNDWNSPVVVQAASVVRGILLRSRPFLLKPGEASPPMILVGNKVVTVSDAKVPNRILLRDRIPASPMKLYYSIRLAPPPAPPNTLILLRVPGPP